MPKGKFRTILKRGGKKYYSIRNADGTFADIQSISKTVKAERKRKAKTKVKPGRGFRGETK